MSFIAFPVVINNYESIPIERTVSLQLSGDKYKIALGDFSNQDPLISEIFSLIVLFLSTLEQEEVLFCQGNSKDKIEKRILYFVVC